MRGIYSHVHQYAGVADRVDDIQLFYFKAESFPVLDRQKDEEG